MVDPLGPQDRFHDADEALVLDERFVRAAPIKEPAARTRMLTARWRISPPQPQPWRGAPVSGPYSGRAARRRRSLGSQNVGWIVTVALVVLIAAVFLAQARG